MKKNSLLEHARRATLTALPEEAKRPVPFTEERKQRFLEALAEGYSIAGAAAQAGVSRRSAYNHRDSDPDFASEWDEQYETGTDVLEDAMRTKALLPNGFLPNVACLRARRPEKWAERGRPEGATAPVINISIIAPTPSELMTLLTDGRLVEGTLRELPPGE